uniref:Uncharacterized protein n=1 Tax=Arion vulgaris TaxID=1028688 RepID=A0A0B6YTX0_9EUPU
MLGNTVLGLDFSVTNSTQYMMGLISRLRLLLPSVSVVHHLQVTLRSVMVKALLVQNTESNSSTQHRKQNVQNLSIDTTSLVSQNY